MEKLLLGEVARKMKEDVSFVLAIPIIQPDGDYYAPGPVAAVFYLDSRDREFFLNDDEIRTLAIVLESSFRAIDAAEDAALGRVRNFAHGRTLCGRPKDANTDTGTDALEIVWAVEPPSTIDKFVLNYDHSDLASLTTKSTTNDTQETKNA